MFSERECQKIRELLSPYLDGRVTTEQRRLVEAHLEQHEACRAEFDSLRATVELLRQVPAVAPRRSFAISAPRPESRPAAFGWLPIGVLRVATGVAVVLLLGLVLADALGTLSTVPSAQQLPKAPEIARQLAQPTPGPQMQEKGDTESTQDRAPALAPRTAPSGPATGGTPAPPPAVQAAPSPAPPAATAPAGAAPATEATPEPPAEREVSQNRLVRQAELALLILVVILIATLSIVTWKRRVERG